MVLGTSTVFAGDSDALKAILKAKSYADAASLVKSTVAQLADNAEKAKAYNHLVNLAMEKYDKEKAIISQNMAAELAKKEKEPYDTLGMFDAAYNDCIMMG